MNRSQIKHAIIALALTTATIFTMVPPVFSQGNRNREQVEIRALSFNLRYGKANDGKNHWKHRKELVAKVAKTAQADIIGTQETLPFQAKFLQQHLPNYHYIGWSREKNPNGEQCGIFYLKKRFEKIKDGQFWLSETPEKKFSKSWDSSLPRVATWVLLKEKASKRELLFLNTHFDHRGWKAREKSAQLIASWLKKNFPKHPIVITGDFNCSTKSAPYKTLVENDLRDTYASSNTGTDQPSGTFNRFSGYSRGSRIDWILVSNHFQTTSAKIIRTNENGRYPSDHYPVSASLIWAKQGIKK